LGFAPFWGGCATLPQNSTTPKTQLTKALEVPMEVSEALKLIDRLNNLPEIYDRVETAVCGIVHRYYSEMYAVEVAEAEIINKTGFGAEKLSSLLDKKRDIHKKYWSNQSSFYTPCSAGSDPERIWETLTNIEVLQNGDAENSLYIFSAKQLSEDGSLGVSVAFQIKLIDGELFIEHEFFG
jgi:hypothetical protein